MAAMADAVTSADRDANRARFETDLEVRLRWVVVFSMTDSDGRRSLYNVWLIRSTFSVRRPLAFALSLLIIYRPHRTDGLSYSPLATRHTR